MSNSLRSRFFRLFLVITLILFPGHRLPAPIQEVPESPTPASKAKTTPKPKSVSKSDRSNEDSQRQRTAVKPTPTPAVSFAGTWVGVSGALRGRTVTVNSTQSTVTIDGGPWGRETGNVEANTGSQLVWSTTPVSVRVKWTFTLLAGAKTAQLTNKHFLGSETGTFEKRS